MCVYACMLRTLVFSSSLFFDLVSVFYSILMLFHTIHNSIRTFSGFLFILLFVSNHTKLIPDKKQFSLQWKFQNRKFPFSTLSLCLFLLQHLLPLSLPSLYTRIVRFFHSDEKNYMENLQENSPDTNTTECCARI